MSLFTIATASGLTDRIAAIQRGIHNTCVLARQASSPGGNFARATQTNDYQIENNFITPGFNFEQSLSGVVLLGGSSATVAMVNALDTHTGSAASPGVTFDTYLNNSGLQMSEYFAVIYGTVKGNNLSAHNVFAESDILMASSTKVSAGNWTFAQGTNLGSGSGKYSPLPSLNTGEQKVIAQLPSGVSTSNCTMSVSGLDDAGHVQQASFSFPNGLNNAAALVSSSLKFRTITNVAVVTDTGIANTSGVTFVNSRERIVTY